jgi:hypothetical protein
MTTAKHSLRCKRLAQGARRKALDTALSDHDWTRAYLHVWDRIVKTAHEARLAILHSYLDHRRRRLLREVQD